MSKKPKKPPLRNEFTDALNEEITERKIIERTQPQDKVFQKTSEVEEVQVDDFSFGEFAEEEVAVETKPKIEKPIEKVSLEKTPAPEPESVEVETDSKLEERILTEADNTFFDEKTKETADERPTFHSKALKREATEKTPPQIESETKTEATRKITHAEKFGMVISVAMLVYAYVTLDKPLYFLSLSLMAHLFRPIIGLLFGKKSHAVQNAMHSFSIVLFFGALFFLFTGQ